MKTNITIVSNSQEEFLTLWEAVKYSHESCKEIIAEVKARLTDEENTDQRELAVLEERSNKTQNAAIERMLEDRKKKISSKTYHPTDEEKNAFYEEIGNGQKAVEDAVRARQNFITNVEAAIKELQETKSRMLNQATPELAKSWFYGLQTDFDKLYK